MRLKSKKSAAGGGREILPSREKEIERKRETVEQKGRV